MSLRKKKDRPIYSEVDLPSSSDDAPSLTASLVVLSPPDDNPDYHTIAESRQSIMLSKRLTQTPTQLDLLGNGTITDNEFKLFIRGYSELDAGINATAGFLLDALLITVTRKGTNGTMVSLPLRDYMEMRGLANLKETRQQVKRDMNALQRIRFEYRGRGKSRGSWFNVNLYGGTSGIRNSIIFFRFNEDFLNLFFGSHGAYFFMYYPRATLKINPKKNPHTRPLVYCIAAHKRMNVGKPNENTISVETLLQACPGMPSYDEVMASDRAIAKRIIEPLERDLDAIGSILTWRYQFPHQTPLSYDDFRSANVVFTWRNYPNTQTITDGREHRRTKKTHLQKSARQYLQNS